MLETIEYMIILSTDTEYKRGLHCFEMGPNSNHPRPSTSPVTEPNRCTYRRSRFGIPFPVSQSMDEETRLPRPNDFISITVLIYPDSE